MGELRDAQARIQELSMQVEDAHPNPIPSHSPSPSPSPNPSLKVNPHQVEDAQAELSAKLEKTKQFLSMRTLLTKKNVVVRQLREQLKENGIAPAGDD